MKREDDEKLWDLLGKAADPKISPFFARNVLREIRQPHPWAGFSGWFALRRLIPVTGVALTLIAAVFLRIQSSVAPLSAVQSGQETVLNAQDYEVVADLDDLLAWDDNSLWDDSALL